MACFYTAVLYFRYPLLQRGIIIPVVKYSPEITVLRSLRLSSEVIVISVA